MSDYLDIYRKFKDINDIADYINDVELLRLYHKNKQYQQMKAHIANLATKYALEMSLWNMIYPTKTTNHEIAYQSAEDFLQMVGTRLALTKLQNYQQRLSKDERDYIESMMRAMGKR